MAIPSRREMLGDTARGMLLAGLGSAVVADLGLAPAWAKEEPGRLTFGAMEPLVEFIAQTPPEKIVAAAIAKLRSGTTLRELVSAAALANARAFGGEDYIGFHTLMALAPAWSMAVEEGSSSSSAVPVLKVLHRNAKRLSERGAGPDVLKTCGANASPASDGRDGARLRDQVRARNLTEAELAFAPFTRAPKGAGLDALMEMVDDGAEVHRTVLVAKSLELAGFVGSENAHTLLRQSIHYCVKSENYAGYAGASQELRQAIPALLEKHGLMSARKNIRRMDDAWIQSFAKTVLGSAPVAAAEAVAIALVEGVHTGDIGEALALGSNHLVLRDKGRYGNMCQPGKPEGSVHGDSVGVHSGDSTHSWRAIARAGNARTLHSSLLLAGYQLARDRKQHGEAILTAEPVHAGAPAQAALKIPADKLAGALNDAIRGKDQALAAAIVFRWGELGGDSNEARSILRRWSTTEDGALHAEKYYRTACDDFATTRTSLRWTHLAGLARVTASARGFPADGVGEALEMLVKR